MKPTATRPLVQRQRGWSSPTKGKVMVSLHHTAHSAQRSLRLGRAHPQQAWRAQDTAETKMTNSSGKMKQKPESEGGKGSRMVAVQTLATRMGRQLCPARCRDSLPPGKTAPRVFYLTGLNHDDTRFWEGHNPGGVISVFSTFYF